MNRHISYAFPYTSPSPPKHHSTIHHTSSAFSASANPNEDWTKISDLAERRRIQNRIAQRNYRKKLKKRLEDLEKRAGSSSASPELKSEELEYSSFHILDQATQPKDAADHNQRIAADRRQSFFNGGSRTGPEDRTMFSHQYTRQLSTSPPPFPYSSRQASSNSSTSQYSQPESYEQLGFASSAFQSCSMYQPAFTQGYSGALTTLAPPIKQEMYGEDDINPFSMSYASLSGMDMLQTTMYQEPLLPVSVRPTVAHRNAAAPCNGYIRADWRT